MLRSRATEVLFATHFSHLCHIVTVSGLAAYTNSLTVIIDICLTAALRGSVLDYTTNSNTKSLSGPTTCHLLIGHLPNLIIWPYADRR